MSRKHQALLDIEAGLESIEQTTQVIVGGHKYVLRLLSRGQETEARSLVDAENILTAYADSNVPQLAFALVSVDGVSATELWEPSDDEERKAFAIDPARWRRMRAKDWIASRETVLTERLWLAYLQLKDRVGKALDELEDFSNRTPSGS